MQTVPNGWAEFLAAEHKVDFKAVINNVTYTYSAIKSAQITKAMMDKLTIGQAPSAMLDMVFLPSETIPEAAKVECYVRLTDYTPTVIVTDELSNVIRTDDGYVLTASYTLGTDWIPFGTFYIDTRELGADGFMTITAYDRMLAAEQDFPSTAGSMTMSAAVTYIAAALGIGVDSRTTELIANYGIDSPVGVYTMREVLCGIAAASGGNFIITENNKLRLIRLSSPASAAESPAQKCDVLGSAVTIGKVTLYPDDDTQYSSGTGGYEIKSDCVYATQEICDSVQKLLNNTTYLPYSAGTVILNPALELGDSVTIDGNNSILASMVFTVGIGMAADVEAPIDTEINHEYPYQARTREERRTAASISKIEKDTESIRLSVEGIDVEGKAKTEIIATLNSLVLSSEAASGGASITLSNEDSSVKIDGDVTIGNISANKITSGEIDAEIVKIKNLDASNINTGTLSAIDIVGCTLYADSNKDTFTAIKTDGIYIHALNKYGRDTIKASLTADEDSACLELGTDQSGYVRKQYSSGVGHTIWVGDSSETTGIQINFTKGTVTVYKNGTATAL